MQSPRTPGVRRRLPRCPPQTAQPHAQGKVACPPSGGYAASRGSSLSWLPGRPGTGGHAPLPQSWTAGTPSPTPLALACRQVPAARAATCQERFLLPPCRTNPCDLRTPGGADCRTNPMSSWRPPSPPRPLTGLLESAVIRACPLDVWRVPSNLSSPSPSICANPRHLRTSPWSVAGSCETNPIRQNTSSTRRIRLASEAGSAGCPLPGLPAAICANVCHLRTSPWSPAGLLQNKPNTSEQFFHQADTTSLRSRLRRLSSPRPPGGNVRKCVPSADPAVVSGQASAKRTQLAPGTAPSRARPPDRPRDLGCTPKGSSPAATVAPRNEPNSSEAVGPQRDTQPRQTEFGRLPTPATSDGPPPKPLCGTNRMSVPHCATPKHNACSGASSLTTQ
jgi:hypothetical protein